MLHYLFVCGRVQFAPQFWTNNRSDTLLVLGPMVRTGVAKKSPNRVEKRSDPGPYSIVPSCDQFLHGEICTINPRPHECSI